MDFTPAAVQGGGAIKPDGPRGAAGTLPQPTGVGRSRSEVPGVLPDQLAAEHRPGGACRHNPHDQQPALPIP